MGAVSVSEAFCRTVCGNEFEMVLGHFVSLIFGGKEDRTGVIVALIIV